MADRSRSRSRSRSPAPAAPAAAEEEAATAAAAADADAVPLAVGSVVDINAGSAAGESSSAVVEEFELYVGNLSWETRDNDLVTEMSKSGKVRVFISGEGLFSFLSRFLFFVFSKSGLGGRRA